MSAILPHSLDWEDLGLFIWLVLIEPLLYRLFGNMLGNVQPWDLGSYRNPVLGALFFLAALGGLVVVGTRAPGQIGSDMFSGVAGYARLPMLVTLGYFLLYGFAAFGNDVPLAIPCVLFGFYLVISMIYSRLPVAPVALRRLIITPMIILGTWNFSALMRMIFAGFDLRALLNTPALRDPNSSFTFVLGLLFASIVVFYLVFILAPRQIAYPSGSWGAWLVRFAIYMLGMILNVGWLFLP